MLPPLRSLRASISIAARSSVPCLLALWPAPLYAAEPWLRLEASAHCAGSAAPLTRRIEGQIAGARNLELTVEVRLRDRGRDTEGRVQISRGAEVVAEKTLVTPTCAEAREAVASVVALALSTEPSPEDVPERNRHANEIHETPQHRAARDPASAPLAASVPTLRIDRGVTQAAVTDGTREWEAHLATGVDIGTLSEPTAIAGAGLSAIVGDWELRGSLWYGLPAIREEVSSATATASRVEFGATRVELCRATDGGSWLSLCAGTEARLIRLESTSDGPSGREHSERVTAGLGVGAGARFVYRSAVLQPTLAVTAELPLAGAPRLAERAIVRATVGAALPL